MVSCTQFPGNLIPSEIDLILPADQSGSRLELEIHASKRFENLVLEAQPPVKFARYVH